MGIQQSVEIRAPIEKVFELVDDPQKRKLWAEGMEDPAFTSDFDPNNPAGAKFKQRIKEGGRVVEYDGEITAYAKNQAIGIRMAGSQFAMELDYRFTATDDGTRVDHAGDVIYTSGFARLMGGLFGWFTGRIAAKQLRKLKELAEAE